MSTWVLPTIGANPGKMSFPQITKNIKKSTTLKTKITKFIFVHCGSLYKLVFFFGKNYGFWKTSNLSHPVYPVTYSLMLLHKYLF